MKDFLYRLCFTRDDDLDLLQLLFVLLILYFMVVFVLAGLKILSVSVAAWSVFGSVFGILAIAGTPKWVAELVARSKMPGEVARGIASSQPVEMSTDVQEIISMGDRTSELG